MNTLAQDKGLPRKFEHCFELSDLQKEEEDDEKEEKTPFLTLLIVHQHLMCVDLWTVSLEKDVFPEQPWYNP